MLTPDLQLPPGGMPPFLIIQDEDKRKKKGIVEKPRPVPIVPPGPPN